MNPNYATTPSAPAGDSNGAASGGVLAETKNKLTTSARDAAAKVKSVAADTTAKAREQAAQIASDKKETAAKTIGGYSAAMRDTAKSLEEKDPNIAYFTARAADRLEGVADYLRSRDLRGLRADAEGLARRHPGVFFGGMFLAGLVLGNVLKASRAKVTDAENDSDDASDATLSFADLPSASI